MTAAVEFVIALAALSLLFSGAIGLAVLFVEIGAWLGERRRRRAHGGELPEETFCRIVEFPERRARR